MTVKRLQKNWRKKRRINKAHQKKLEFLIQELHKSVNLDETCRITLTRENKTLEDCRNTLMEENKTLKEKAEQLLNNMSDLLGYDNSTEADLDTEDIKPAENTSE